jgi:hypothetical protein
MITTHKSFYLINIKSHWFGFEKKLNHLISLSTYQYIKKNEYLNHFGCIAYPTHTIEINLNENIDAIRDRFSNNIKKEIKKGAKYDIQCSQENNIDLFLPLYNDFAAAKKIYPVKKKTIEAFGKHFQTTFALFNNEIIVAHSYIVDEEAGITRLYQSCSKRLENGINKEIIGIANKMLTVEDIFYFKRKGLVYYDLGGIAPESKDKDLQGINHFKMQFGGTPTSYINIDTVPYYLLRKISEKLDFRYK